MVNKFIKKDWLDSLVDNAKQFNCGDPFPHLVIDNFFDVHNLEKLLQKYPSVKDKKWWTYNNLLEKKYALNDLSVLDDDFKEFFDELNSDIFTEFLEKLTGLEDILCDQTLYGGGLHQIVNGGKLDVHEDFNIHKDLVAFRKVNVITYLNKDWHESYGGHLQLWNKDMTKCVKSVLPVFNRVIIFRTDMNSNHGHPVPLTCPKNISRKSLATYYYTKCSDNDLEQYRSTYYKGLPVEENKEELDLLRERRKHGRI